MIIIATLFGLFGIGLTLGYVIGKRRKDIELPSGHYEIATGQHVICHRRGKQLVGYVARAGFLVTREPLQWNVYGKAKNPLHNIVQPWGQA